MWFKNRRAKFRKKQRASKSHTQRADSPSLDGESASHCKTKDEACADRRRAQPHNRFNARDDDASPSPETGQRTASESLDEQEEDEEDNERLRPEDQSLPSSPAVFQGDVGCISPMAGSSAVDASRISKLAYHGLHPFHLHGTFRVLAFCSHSAFRVVTRNAYRTRMLAINVSIPNLTVVRLEQSRSPQLRFQREGPTDIGVD